MTQEQKDKVAELRAGGMGYGTIAKAVGISENTVKSFCRRMAAHKEVDQSEHRCLCCGIPVAQNPGRKEKKFCSDRCRAKWWNTHPEMSENRTWQDIKCLNCGRAFKVYGKSSRKYCCHECYVQHRFGGGA